MATANQIKWKEAGLCHWCGAGKNDNKFCAACRERHNAYGRANMAKRRKEGIVKTLGGKHKLVPRCACGASLNRLPAGTSECPMCVAEREAREEFAKPRGFPWDGCNPDHVQFSDQGYRFLWIRRLCKKTDHVWPPFWNPYPQCPLAKCHRCKKLVDLAVVKSHYRSFKDRNELWFFVGFPKTGPDRAAAEEEARVSLSGLCPSCYDQLRPVMKLHRQNYEVYKLRLQLQEEITNVRKASKEHR